MSDHVDSFLTQFIGDPKTSVQRDLALNFKKAMEESVLDEQERYLNLLAVATSLHTPALMEFASFRLNELGLSEEHILEARENAAIMGMLNTYYKFKSFLPPEVLENYSRAGLRMQSLAKPVNGKERFEMMSFAVSVVNGCPTCVASHERALTQLGVPADKIHELARIAAICKGLVTLKN